MSENTRESIMGMEPETGRWILVFLGLVILAAVLVNTYIRNKALGGARSR